MRSKKSIVFNDGKGQGVLEKALNCKFSQHWCELDKAWLRKQIMPKVQEVLSE